MEVFLTTVVDTFEIIGKGLIIEPSFPLTEYKFDKKEKIRVETPEGQELFCDSYFQVPLQNPIPKTLSACCTLLKVSKQQIPIGSKIFIIDKNKDEITA